MYKVPNTQFVYAMHRDHQPVLTVESGAILQFDTHDCFQGQIKTPKDLLSDVDFSHINPATGPVAIAGAEVGDVLVVEILDIKVGDQAVSVAVPGLGLLGDSVEKPQTKIIKLSDNTAIYGDQKWAIQPMIGVIGTAPEGEAIPCGRPDAHGGNMDCRDIGIGSRVYLPVFVPGALLAMGDVHALQGDGEICGTGFECAAKVLVRVSLLKKKTAKIPFIDNGQEIMAVGFGPTLEEASKLAAEQLLLWLQDQRGYSFNEAYMLMSAKMDLRICQVVNPAMTVRAVLRKNDVYQNDRL